MGGMAGAILRANPGYELVLLDRLSEADRDALDGEQDLYGVLRPRVGADLHPRAASADTALLFLTLAEAAKLPNYVSARLGASTDRAVARLVLDGVLEIEHNGELLSGARAGDALLAGSADGGQGRIGELSLAALHYGQELAALGVDQMQLAARLYRYGRRPITAALAERFSSGAAIESHLGIDSLGRSRALLDADWAQVAPPAGTRSYWRTWRARWLQEGGGHRDGGYKLYVSPGLEGLGAALASVAGSLAGARGVRAFKVAEHLDGLCRPDKLVVYFDRIEDLQAGAFRLREELAGTAAHGVPFTAAITSDGLLSWGADPPLLDGAPTSWRQWVTGRLAEYLEEGRRGAEIEPCQFALRRLRLDGIDADSWIPANGIWEQALASA